MQTNTLLHVAPQVPREETEALQGVYIQDS